MKKAMIKKNKKKGFTLIELVVVIAILGILAAILIPVIGGFIERANIAADEANARNLFNSASMLAATGTDSGDLNTASTYSTLMNLPSDGSTWAVAFSTTSSGEIIIESATFGAATYNKDGSTNP